MIVLQKQEDSKPVKGKHNKWNNAESGKAKSVLKKTRKEHKKIYMSIITL